MIWNRTIWLAAAFVTLAASGWARAQGPPVCFGPPPTIVIVCEAAGQVEEVSDGLREVVSNTGIPVAVLTENWGTGLGMIPDHNCRDNQLRASICLAQKVMGWRRLYPHARIVLVGYSSGANVTLMSTFYTAPGTVDRIILLAASVAADQDLRPALHASREGVDSFFSNQDSTLHTAIDFLGVPTGKHCPAAGTVGFRGGLGYQLEPGLYCKLRQYGWNQGWERFHHQGDLCGYAHHEFLEAYVFPMAAGRMICP